MTENKINTTDEELVELAGSSIIGTPGGLKAQHAQAELTRRLMISINNSSKETSRYSDRLLDLTILLFFLAVIQIIISLKFASTSLEEWAIYSIIVICAISYIVIDINKIKKNKEK